MRSLRTPILVAIAASTFGLASNATTCHGADPTQPKTERERRGLELFEKKIRPVLVQYCYECHAEDSDDIGGELLVDSRQGLIHGGETGPAIELGSPRESLLVKAIEYRGLEMPPDEKLPDSVAADFRRWIQLGAPDPRKAKHADSTTPVDADDDPVELWSLQPIEQVNVPASDSDWALHDIDRFVVAELSANGITPNGDAAPEVLLRRVYFDLTGLPPTPEQIEDFLADPSAEHYARVVDQLLCSQAFGERWARHWLDIARYGESAGSSRDVLMLYSWRYRDYVIAAFNDDVPYNRFVTEQIAGDLLDAADDDERKRLTIATGLLAIGSKSLNGGNLTYDIIDDQIDVVSKSIMGLTVSCARCHDHKFDPVPTKDYYSLAGIFLSTDTRYGGSTKRPGDAKSKRQVYLTLDGEMDAETAQRRETIEKQLGQLRKQVRSSKNRVASLRRKVPQEFRDDPAVEIPAALEKRKQTDIRQFQGAIRVLAEREKKLADLESEFEQFGDQQYAFGVRDSKQIKDANVLVRGEKNQQGDSVPRGFLSAVNPLKPAEGQVVEPFDKQQSGRRQLALWLTHPNHPLTSRVAVNRIWQHLLGQGIVPTVDNFGVTGMPPSHPGLLDYLADRFVNHHHWSQKNLIREIVLSRTYRLSSLMNEQAATIDPDNRLRWRMDRRRLEAEPLRDAILAVSGLLRLQPLEGSLVMQIGEGEVGRNIDTSILEQPFDHRSVYLPIIRGMIPEELKLFDFPEPSNVQGLRDSNNTPRQSLFFMNSPFVIRAAKHFASRLLEDPQLSDDQQRIRFAMMHCFGRPPEDSQVTESLSFIDSMTQTRSGDDSRMIAWTTYCQTLIASAPFRFVD